MSDRFPWLHESEACVAGFGQKGAFLARAVTAGYRVPEGFLIAGEQALALAGGDAQARKLLEDALLQMARWAREGRLAVRSSPFESLPGALLTLLDVPVEVEAVVAAITAAVDSNKGAAARAQRAARGAPVGGRESDHHRNPEIGPLPILVQRFIPARSAGDFGAVVFTRDPDSGARGLCGEYQPGFGAAEVVSGRRIPRPLKALSAHSLAQQNPVALAEIEALARGLEDLWDEPLDLELIRAQGQLWLLQVRPLVLSPEAQVRLALEAIDEDSPRFRRYAQLLFEGGLGGLVQHELPSPSHLERTPCLRGLAASPGVGSGVVVTDSARAIERSAREPVVLFRNHATPEDVTAFKAAQAVVTTSGGLTCHAAVIARGLRIPAVVGCAEAQIEGARGLVGLRRAPNEVLLREGDLVSVDARRGLVYRGFIAGHPRVISPELTRLARELRKLRPCPLWAYGAPEPTLRAKDEACLDGILCPVSDPDSVPPASGRECWLEVDAAHADELVPKLPRGWGVVVRGALEEIPFERLRSLSRLRPLGVHLIVEPTNPSVPIALELAVVAGHVGISERLSGLAPRMLARAMSPTDFPAISAAGSPQSGREVTIGVLCETELSLKWMLGLALRGLRPTGPGTHTP